MAVYLGVDGGGTKIAFMLLTSYGRRLAALEGPSRYCLEHGMDRVRHVVVEGIHAIARVARLAVDEINFGFIAIPGYGESSADARGPRLAPR